MSLCNSPFLRSPRRWRHACLLAIAVLMFSFCSRAGATTLTFNELPTQPVDDLSFMGVKFDFKVGGIDSLDARYNGGGPGIGTFVQDPTLEGDSAGILTLDFLTPVSTLQFGVALSTAGTVAPGFVVSTYDASLALLATYTITTTQTLTFTEAQFVNPGGVPLGRAVIDFNQSVATRFALDNLTFNPVPEPSTIALACCGALALLFAARRGTVA